MLSSSIRSSVRVFPFSVRWFDTGAYLAVVQRFGVLLVSGSGFKCWIAKQRAAWRELVLCYDLL